MEKKTEKSLLPKMSVPVERRLHTETPGREGEGAGITPSDLPMFSPRLWWEDERRRPLPFYYY